jgi:demethylmenaquinone methyltransferase/2-methoxy-6-polyprenyl-1,4-benzoquinol methylase
MDQKTALIEAFFAETGPTYDTVVHRFTLGIDRRWKKTLLAKIEAAFGTSPAQVLDSACGAGALRSAPLSAGPRVLDLACGTGILTLDIARTYPGSPVVGVDISGSYLAVARKKVAAGGVRNVTLVQCRAEDFVSEQPFNVVTTSYLPKYADIPRLIRNITRMLAPGGLVLFHDFTYPAAPILRAVFALYFKLAGPIGGFWYPAWRAVFRELPRVIQETHWVTETVEAMQQTALREIQVQSLTCQGSALVSARKA